MPKPTITVCSGRTYVMRFSNPDAQVDQVINRFTGMEEDGCIAARVIQMPRAILLLQLYPDDPNSGAVYLYNRQKQEFHLLYFDGFDGDEFQLTIEAFERLISDADLLRYAESPRLLKPAVNHRVISITA